MVAELVAEGVVPLIDGTRVGCTNYRTYTSAATPATGYCSSKSEFVWGMRLVLVADRKGVPVGYDLVGQRPTQERDSTLVLATG